MPVNSETALGGTLETNENFAPEVDSILAGDLKDLITTNPDVKCSESLKKVVFDIKDDDTLLKVTKEFGSITIIDVKIITDELLISDLFA
jgi:hypothetical protein